MTNDPIFIGGTGRSGSTILAKILGKHQNILNVNESRFIIDPGGLISLVDAFTHHWGKSMTDKALSDFDSMMSALRDRSIGMRILRKIVREFHTDLNYWFSPSEYAQIGLGIYLGIDHYDATLNDFLEEIEEFRFRGYNLSTKSFTLLPYIRQGKRLSREKLIKICSEFVNNLFDFKMKKDGNLRWCDETPENYLRVDFLYELFPNMKLIHIYRDPKDVISSYKRQSWAPTKFTDSVKLMNNLMAEWKMKRTLVPEASFLEIKFEDLIKDNNRILAKICRFLHLELQAPMAEVDISHHHIGRHKKDLTDEEIATAESELNDWIS